MTNEKDQLAAELDIPGIEADGDPVKKDATVIHTMPKSFLSSTTPNKDKTRRVGLLILVGGGFLLIVIFAAAYYYLTNYNSKVNIEPINQGKEVNNKDMLTQEDSRKDDEIIKPDPVAPPPTSPDVGIRQEETIEEVDIKRVDIATSTAPDATSTKAEILPEPAVFSYSSDSDQDGLSDLEEVLLGTDLESRDSDNDGYDDKSELLKLYNPDGTGAIVTNPRIKKYTNSTYRYSLYYPDAWLIERVGGDESIMIKLDNNQFFQIIVSLKTEGLSIEDWYKKEFNVPTINHGQRLYKQGWSGIKSEDDMTFYLVYPNEEKIYTITYNLGLQRIISHKNIFEMMVNSLERT